MMRFTLSLTHTERDFNMNKSTNSRYSFGEDALIKTEVLKKCSGNSKWGGFGRRELGH